MSRIGKRPIEIPSGVTVTLNGDHITVKGPKGELQRMLPGEMTVTKEDSTITVTRPSEVSRHKALHGLTRVLIANMVEGVTNGFEKNLEIRGVGYKAEETKDGARLVVGYSHPVDYQAPEGISIAVDGGTKVKISGINKEVVGQVAAEIRKVRPPEPYKGKGIRYVDEHVRTKAGKTGAK
ncbi:MAG: 50S ribosomal protein L6 [Gemmatimonadota bacterium]|nr:50S ribosomal protein L6 [Gemmatimonadota bacterium]MDH5803984.1 50S ribosomal protein L6 [Gemmatimonadota bacterium]